MLNVSSSDLFSSDEGLNQKAQVLNRKLSENNKETSTAISGEQNIYNFVVVAGVTRENLQVEAQELD